MQIQGNMSYMFVSPPPTFSHKMENCVYCVLMCEHSMVYLTCSLLMGMWLLPIFFYVDSDAMMNYPLYHVVIVEGNIDSSEVEVSGQRVNVL